MISDRPAETKRCLAPEIQTVALTAEAPPDMRCDLHMLRRDKAVLAGDDPHMGLFRRRLAIQNRQLSRIDFPMHHIGRQHVATALRISAMESVTTA